MNLSALYIDPRGPYPLLLGPARCWDLTRDARLYVGPHPVIAHPPCGPWGRLRHLYRGDEHDCAPRAVDQVREFGGVLEHPAGSLLWRECLGPPSHACDGYGGRTYEVDQCDWGHVARKRTWLYVVGVDHLRVMAQLRSRSGTGTPTHGIWYGSFERSGHKGPRLLGASKEIRRRTPVAFAQLLIDIASRAEPMRRSA